jgi:hypothetical protein
LDAVVGLIGSRFGRSEPRARVGAYVRGLLAGLERKNGWTLAAVSPDGMQRLLRTADRDVDGVGDDVRGYVLDGLADPDPDPDPDADPGEAGPGCSSPTTPGSSRRAAARPEW